jgi:hypothetical protein
MREVLANARAIGRELGERGVVAPGTYSIDSWIQPIATWTFSMSGLSAS